MCAISDRAPMLGPPTIKRFTSGRTARCASSSRIRRAAWEWRSSCKRRAMPSKDTSDKVNSLYLQGLSTRQIADVTSISKSGVGEIVKKSGIARDRATSQILGCKRTTRIPFTWSFFPLTPEKAWLLGLIYGDGSLYNDGRTISITSGDSDVIDNINHLFGDKLSISSPKSTYRAITLHSGRLWKELNTCFALVPNKSRTLCYPELPDE